MNSEHISEDNLECAANEILKAKATAVENAFTRVIGLS